MMRLQGMLLALILGGGSYGCSGTTEAPPEQPPEEPPANTDGEEATVEDPNAVQKVLEANSGEIKACYDKARETQPDISGTIAVTLVLAGGAVSMLTLDEAETTISDDQLRGCVVSHVRAWRFPPHVEGEIFLPLSLKPTDPATPK